MDSWIDLLSKKSIELDSFWYQNLCDKCGKDYVDAYYFDGDWQDWDLLIATWESGK